MHRSIVKLLLSSALFVPLALGIAGAGSFASADEIQAADVQTTEVQTGEVQAAGAQATEVQAAAAATYRRPVRATPVPHQRKAAEQTLAQYVASTRSRSSFPIVLGIGF
jgi:hypothetical protein